jgi:putative 10TM heavy-metal exporter
MDHLVTEALLRPLADAFMQVGVFVALMLVPFAWARHRWADRLDALLERHRRLGPLTAAAMTMPPGCGGAIMVMTVYSRGAVSYGSAVAALVATMGDASWVLLAFDPWLTVQLKLGLLVVGSATGYAVDALGLEPRRRRVPAPAAPARPVLPVPAAATARPAFLSVGLLPVALWVVLGAGAGLSVPVTFQLTDPSDLYLAVGLVGTLLAVVSFAKHRGRLADDDAASVRPATLAQSMAHGVHEVAFVTVWVAIAYLAWSGVTHGLGFDGSQLPVWGAVGVVVGACIGLVPGCAVQIVFAGIFAAGGMPLSTLVANTVSQDGDALLPLLALEHRSAVVATFITTVPALLTGMAILWLA